MEKFGLFDLIDRFSPQKNGRADFSETGERGGEYPSSAGFVAPASYGAPPQLLLNQKTKEFLARHDALASEIRAESKKRRKKSAVKNKNGTAKTPAKPEGSTAPKKRGRPKKQEKIQR